jgi:tripartite-type tricarboxylate transporter receptor subunit TctC
MIRRCSLSFPALCVAFLAVLVSGGANHALGQPAWRPDKPIELILPTAAGGANDNVARLIQKVLQDHKIVPTPVVVLNKAGGNQTLALVYLRQNARDPHHLLFSLVGVRRRSSGIVQQHYSGLALLRWC